MICIYWDLFKNEWYWEMKMFLFYAEVLRPSSPTLLFESVPGFNSSKMGRKLLLLSQMMVAWTTLKRMWVLAIITWCLCCFFTEFELLILFDYLLLTWIVARGCRTKFWLLDLEEKVMLWEIFPESGLRLLKFLVSLFWLFSRRRRRSQGLKFVRS